MRNKYTRTNFISWYKDVFGFSNQVVTALYNEQLFKNNRPHPSSLMARLAMSVAVSAVTLAYQSHRWP